jgi:hypothetical protein
VPELDDHREIAEAFPQPPEIVAVLRCRFR